MSKPKLYTLPTINSNCLITIAESANIPFDVKRVFWLTSVNAGQTRGEHAHRTSQQLLICINGELCATLESTTGEHYTFKLSQPNSALYIPPQYWGKLEYAKESIVLALASDEYNENDYIRDYSTFKA